MTHSFIYHPKHKTFIASDNDARVLDARRSGSGQWTPSAPTFRGREFYRLVTRDETLHAARHAGRVRTRQAALTGHTLVTTAT
eukprot:1800466-Prymnesium_polylepis.1